MPAVAVEEARTGRAEEGIPIGAALFGPSARRFPENASIGSFGMTVSKVRWEAGAANDPDATRCDQLS
ncbi:hypothetical protein AB0L88_25620 [Saccharopolyspora shandongensis]|uniref:hypothetical protein n=1 Tax=Saccharopolyspora shandongensis TaxID=418495 RepID=UPI003423DC1F